MRPEKIETLDDVKTWIADHDGRIDEKWRQQDKHNAVTEKRFTRYEMRLTSVEKKVVWFSGFAAAFGAIIGSFVK